MSNKLHHNQPEPKPLIAEFPADAITRSADELASANAAAMKQHRIEQLRRVSDDPLAHARRAVGETLDLGENADWTGIKQAISHLRAGQCDNELRRRAGHPAVPLTLTPTMLANLVDLLRLTRRVVGKE